MTTPTDNADCYCKGGDIPHHHLTTNESSTIRPDLPTGNTVLDEQISDVFARACKNNEYFGNDGWYELHTPTARKEIKALIDTVCREARKNEAKINLAPLPVPNQMRSMRNSNTSRKRGAVMYFNKVVKTRLKSRLTQLNPNKDTDQPHNYIEGGERE